MVAPQFTLPQFPSFASLAPEHKDSVLEYTYFYPPYSDYTFPSLWCWDLAGTCQLSELNGNLVTRFADYETGQLFLSFLGHYRVQQTIEELFTYLSKFPDHLPILKLVPEHNLHDFTGYESYYITEDPDNHDYIYAIDELVALVGGKYQTQRNFVKRFQVGYLWEIRVLDLCSYATWNDIETMCRIWIQRQLVKNNNVANDVSALRRLRIISNRLELLGLGVYVDERLIGYSIVEFNQEKFATNLFEHANTDYVGIYHFMRKQLALQLKDIGCLYLNNQQDLGINGLRIAKTRWHPVQFLKKFIIRPK